MSDGGAPSFEAFVQAELPRLLGFGHALTGNRHDAWDLTQEALARVGVRWSRLDRSGNPGGYARTTMVRLNIDRLRRLRRERPVSHPPDVYATDSTGPVFPAWVVTALAELTPRQRTAVVLRFVLDLDAAGIGYEMGCSAGTARSHLSRGLDRLREHAPTTANLEGSVGGP